MAAKKIKKSKTVEQPAEQTLSQSIDQILKAEQMVAIQKNIVLEKAITSEDPNAIMKANEVLKLIDDRDKSDRKSYILDPFEFQNSFGFKDRTASLSYNMLKSMARTPIINAIIRTRINQIAAFAEPQRDKYSIGYVIRKKRIFGSNSQEKVSKQEEKRIEELTMIVENCGINGSWEADDFDGFVRKLVRDSLTYDQCAFEVIRDRKGDIHEFLAVDASTIRLSESYDDDQFKNNDPERKQTKIKGYYPSYVQVHQNNVTADFYPWEMCFGVRNPVTDVNYNGYGTSELEEMVNTITALLWAEDYNRRFFKQGSAPKGILKVSGGMSDTKLQEFRQQWNSTMRGVQNAWKTPILEADKVDWVDLQQSNRDMEFTQWVEFLIKVGCAIFAIDPAEVNFPLQGGAGESGGLFQGSNEARLKQSKDKGLYPILKFLQKRLNKYVISQIDPAYELVFCGMDALSVEQEHKIDYEAIRSYSTVNEIRRKRGMKDIEGGDIILDGIFAQQIAQKQMMDGMGQEGQQNVPDFLSPAEEGEEQVEQGMEFNPIVDAFTKYFEMELLKN
ncbi:MAG: hypothetical protein A3F91_12365 [Flavobacteria bacterium RIFCSPLOWO2_12_FULL_35_11]|nr:MAG: hypothetical protein A3F91_12365 [Flavobacteria bacterium RIFCSPLOWO2_12_FULL_35_11]